MAYPISVLNTFGFSLISCLIVIHKCSVESRSSHSQQGAFSATASSFSSSPAVCDSSVAVLCVGWETPQSDLHYASSFLALFILLSAGNFCLS